mmetsp:Transcript_65861/g.201690  ORF Transcript_65861/g.201690 Transcript_65861/m.201690 type:complete len:259 (+) Transcript_65861:808-1584(+)
MRDCRPEPSSWGSTRRVLRRWARPSRPFVMVVETASGASTRCGTTGWQRARGSAASSRTSQQRSVRRWHTARSCGSKSRRSLRWYPSCRWRSTSTRSSRGRPFPAAQLQKRQSQRSGPRSRRWPRWRISAARCTSRSTNSRPRSNATQLPPWACGGRGTRRTWRSRMCRASCSRHSDAERAWPTSTPHTREPETALPPNCGDCALRSERRTSSARRWRGTSRTAPANWRASWCSCAACSRRAPTPPRRRGISAGARRA